MKHFYEYNPNATERITESHMIEDGIILLEHAPKRDSIVIDGFEEVTSINLSASQFRCLYSEHTAYREANRIVHFSTENDGRTVEVSYTPVASPILAEEMNEIKAHMEDSSLHSGGGGGNAFFQNGGDVFGTALLNSHKTWSPDDLDEYSSPEFYFREQNGRPSKFGDMIMWYNSGSSVGWAYRTVDKWVNLDYTEGLYPAVFWNKIVPFMTAADRTHLDGYGNLILGTTPSTVEGAIWLKV